MSISTEILRLQTAKSDLKTAIEAKGVTVPSATTIDGYASLIGQISQGVQEAEENDVNFYDYDGFRVASFTIAEAKALTQAEYNAILPPTHEGLTFQEWNWTLNDITTYDRQYIDIGANYVTTDGKTHIFVSVKEGDTCEFRITINASNKNVEVDWGDGNTNTYISGTITHTYNTKGIYEVVMQSNLDSGSYYALEQISDSESDKILHITEIRFGGDIVINKAYSMRYYKCKVSIPKSSLQDINSGNFQYADIPCIVVPRGNTGFKSSVCFSQSKAKICFPKTLSSTNWISTFYQGAFPRLIIPNDTANDYNNNFFSNCLFVDIVSIPINFGIASNGANVFNGMKKLTYIDIVQGWTPNNSTILSGSILWTAENIVKFFNKLGTTTNTITLTFGSTNLDKLTADQKAIATNKGYTLA